MLFRCVCISGIHSVTHSPSHSLTQSVTDKDGFLCLSSLSINLSMTLSLSKYLTPSILNISLSQYLPLSISPSLNISPSQYLHLSISPFLNISLKDIRDFQDIRDFKDFRHFKDIRDLKDISNQSQRSCPQKVNPYYIL